MLSKLRNPFILLLAFAAIYIIYAPGLSGGFWLDDYGSLPDLFESVDANGYWEGVFGGYTGPLGRPLSLLTFAWQHASWANPHDFLLFNIVLHILNAGLVFLLCYTLLLRVVPSSEVAPWHRFVLALSACLFWALSPLLVSTVLYVVQRMVLLSSFFVLLACLCFCWGHYLLRLGKDRVAISIFILGCGGFGVLGLLAKESAFLLVVYLLAIKYLYDQTDKPQHWFYRLVIPWALWFACLLFCAYVLVKLQGAFASTYHWREFDLTERLLTESRIVWQYLAQLFLPKASYLGLFHDDFAISRSIFNPITTLWSILGWLLVVGIFILACLKRERLLVFSLAWFIGGHLMESTIIPLELYFEHRNYLPAVGLWFTLVVYARKLFGLIEASVIKRVLLLGLAAYGIFIGGMTYYLSSLWGKPAELSVIYAAERQGSLRARALMVDLYQQMGAVDKAYNYLDEIEHDFPKELAPRIIKIQFSCLHTSQYSDGVDSALIEFAKKAEFSHGTLLSINGLIEGGLWQGQCQYYTVDDLVELLKALLQNPKYVLRKTMLQGFISHAYRKSGELELALSWLRKSPSTGYDQDLLEVVLLASASRYDESLALLQDVRTHRLPHYISEKRLNYFNELEQTIKRDIENKAKLHESESK